MLLLFEKLEVSNLDSDTIFRQSLEQQPQEIRLLHVAVLVKNRVLAVVN